MDELQRRPMGEAVAQRSQRLLLDSLGRQQEALRERFEQAPGVLFPTRLAVSAAQVHGLRGPEVLATAGPVEGPETHAVPHLSYATRRKIAKYRGVR